MQNTWHQQEIEESDHKNKSPGTKSIKNKKGRKLSDLMDLIPPVEVRLKPVPHDVVHQRRVEQHPRADAHRRAHGIDGNPHHHASRNTLLPAV
jgi:hypothetical protein